MTNQLLSILPEERIEEFCSLGKEKSLNNSDYFLVAGDVPFKLGFILKGLFRYVYVNEKGDEFTKGILTENNFISSYSAMILNKPSYFSIEALESSQILEFNWVDLKKLFEKEIFWTQFLLRFIEKGFIIKEKRERDLLLLDAETRYKNFLEEFPGIDQRVKQGIIASYLGIKPETLSRIRKKIIF